MPVVLAVYPPWTIPPAETRPPDLAPLLVLARAFARAEARQMLRDEEGAHSTAVTLLPLLTAALLLARRALLP